MSMRELSLLQVGLVPRMRILRIILIEDPLLLTLSGIEAVITRPRRKMRP
jgi:hypothetical protein